MASKQDVPRVSAAEFVRGFANWRMQAARRPVVVTHHGKDAHVLISLDDYRRLGSGSGVAADALREAQAGLLESLRDGIILVDRQWRVAAINPAAADMLESPASALVGAHIVAAWPALEASLLLAHLARMIDHRERFSGEVPGLIRPRQWLRVDLVPVALGGALILRDVTDTMEGIGEAEARRALAAAIDLDAGIGLARLSVREAVEAANPALAAMIGTDETAIRRVRFSALLAMSARQAFAEALEEVFRTGAPCRIASELVARDGASTGVQLSIAERRSAYASDGAMVVVTRR